MRRDGNNGLEIDSETEQIHREIDNIEQKNFFRTYLSLHKQVVLWLLNVSPRSNQIKLIEKLAFNCADEHDHFLCYQRLYFVLTTSNL